jgi:hypothetical protein
MLDDLQARTEIAASTPYQDDLIARHEAESGQLQCKLKFRERGTIKNVQGIDIKWMRRLVVEGREKELKIRDQMLG